MLPRSTAFLNPLLIFSADSPSSFASKSASDIARNGPSMCSIHQIAYSVTFSSSVSLISFSSDRKNESGTCVKVSESVNPLKSLIEFQVSCGCILELCQCTAEDQLHTSNRAISVFCNDDLGNVLHIRFFLILIGAVNEHHDVGILF